MQVRLKKHKARMVTLPLGQFGAPTLKPVSWPHFSLVKPNIRFRVGHMFDELLFVYSTLCVYCILPCGSAGDSCGHASLDSEDG